MQHLLPLLLAALLSACATQPEEPPQADAWEDTLATLQGLQHWRASGKLALRTSDRAESASLNWLQQGDSTRLLLSGPMGLNSATLRSDGQRLEVQRGENIESWDISDPQAVRASTGWDLPLRSLPYWLKGTPAPEGDIAELQTNNGLLLQLRQNGWDIHYQSHQRFGRYSLPTRLTIRRADTSAKLILRDWTPLTE